MMDRVQYLLAYLAELNELNKEFICTKRVNNVCDEIEKELGVGNDDNRSDNG